MFVDDIHLDGMLHAAYCRSSEAHARIRAVNTERARAAAGVAAVVVHSDLGHVDVALPCLVPNSAITAYCLQFLLAHDHVCYVGQPIAMVLATDRYAAEDAVDLIDIEYDRLDVVLDIERAIEDGSPLVHTDAKRNIAARLRFEVGDVDRAFAQADLVLQQRFELERSAGMPIETRGVVAVSERERRQLTVWDNTQAPIIVRANLSALLGLPYSDVRVISGDIGGGFGPKSILYPEEVLVAWAATQFGRPVKWIEDRREHFVGTTHERLQIHDLELAATRDGIVMGVRDRILHDNGAFMSYGIPTLQVAATQLPGPYRIPAFAVDGIAVYTTTVPISPYRGAGRPHACFAIERAMDHLAAEIGLGRDEVRHRNFIGNDEFPYERPGLEFADGLPVILDSGDYSAQLDRLLAIAGWEGFADRQAHERAQGRNIGIGLACYVEGTGIGPYEGVSLEVEPTTGRVIVASGLSSQGQGHETIFAQHHRDRGRHSGLLLGIGDRSEPGGGRGRERRCGRRSESQREGS
jgi:aerobic carbon-monoxide dehydrogenase large subunit